MVFVLNKNKIISYTIATSIVIILFIFSVSLIPNQDTKIVQVSTNIINSIENKNIGNNVNNNNNYNMYTK